MEEEGGRAPAAAAQRLVGSCSLLQGLSQKLVSSPCRSPGPDQQLADDRDDGARERIGTENLGRADGAAERRDDNTTARDANWFDQASCSKIDRLGYGAYGPPPSSASKCGMSHVFGSPNFDVNRIAVYLGAH